MRSVMAALIVALFGGAQVPALQPALADVVQLVEPGQTVIVLQRGGTRGLVRESRSLMLPAGSSLVSYSWQAPGFDAASATLSLDQGAVGEATRPAGQDKTLVWQVNMPQAGAAQAVITYFLDGLKWRPSYVLALQPEGKATLEGTLYLTNETGMALREAQVQIAAPGSVLADRPEAAKPIANGAAPVFTIEPGQTATRRFVLVPDLPATVRYAYQADRYGGNVEQILRLGFDEIGVAAIDLPDGPMLIQDAADPQTPIFKTQLAYQAGQEFEVDMGPEPEVVVERKLMSSRRSNLELDRFGRVSGLDTTEEYLLTVRNHLPRPITLEIVETALSTWDLKGPTPARKEISWVQFDLPVGAEGAGELKFGFVKHAGTRIKK
jgi:hypothetical protein